MDIQGPTAWQLRGIEAGSANLLLSWAFLWNAEPYVTHAILTFRKSPSSAPYPANGSRKSWCNDTFLTELQKPRDTSPEFSCIATFGSHLLPLLILLHTITREQLSNPNENSEEGAQRNGVFFLHLLNLEWLQLKLIFIPTLGFSVGPPVVLSYTHLSHSLLWPYPLFWKYERCLFTNVS